MGESQADGYVRVCLARLKCTGVAERADGMLGMGEYKPDACVPVCACNADFKGYRWNLNEYGWDESGNSKTHYKTKTEEKKNKNKKRKKLWNGLCDDCNTV